MLWLLADCMLVMLVMLGQPSAARDPCHQTKE